MLKSCLAAVGLTLIGVLITDLYWVTSGPSRSAYIPTGLFADEPRENRICDGLPDIRCIFRLGWSCTITRDASNNPILCSGNKPGGPPC